MFRAGSASSFVSSIALPFRDTIPDRSFIRPCVHSSTRICIRRHFRVRRYPPSYRRTHHHRVRHTPSARDTSHQSPRPAIQGKDSPLIRHLTFIYLTYPLRLHETLTDRPTTFLNSCLFLPSLLFTIFFFSPSFPYHSVDEAKHL